MRGDRDVSPRSTEPSPICRVNSGYIKGTIPLPFAYLERQQCLPTPFTFNKFQLGAALSRRFSSLNSIAHREALRRTETKKPVFIPYAATSLAFLYGNKNAPKRTEIKNELTLELTPPCTANPRWQSILASHFCIAPLLRCPSLDDVFEATRSADARPCGFLH
jgi:hypothetical protein